MTTLPFTPGEIVIIALLLGAIAMIRKLGK